MKILRLLFARESFCLFYILFANNLVFAGEVENVRWNGFVTTGVAQTSENIGFDSGIGPEQNFSSLSRVGLTLSTSLSNKTDAMFQLVARGDRSLNSDSTIDFALIHHRFDDNWSVRLGRQRLQAWLISEYINVGYLYPWIQVPMEVYSLQPLSSLNGVSLQYEQVFDIGRLEFNTFYLGGATEFNFSYKLKAQTVDDIRSFGGAVSYSTSNLLLRGVYTRGHVNLVAQASTVQDLSAIISGAPPIKLSIPLSYNLGWTEFTSLGLKYTNDNIILWSEYASEKATRIVDFRSGVYGTLGYNIAALQTLLYLTSSSVVESRSAELGIVNARQNTIGVGGNYSFTKDSLIKIQANRTDFPDMGYSLATYIPEPLASPQVNGNPSSVMTYLVSFDAAF